MHRTKNHLLAACGALLLSLGLSHSAAAQSVLDFNCTATMPNVTRLVGQVTLFDYVALPSLSPTPPPMVRQVRSS